MAGLIRRVGHALAKITSGGLNLLFPPRCVYCYGDFAEAKELPALCPACCCRLVPEKWIVCRHCGGAISEEWQSMDHCALCKTPPRLFDTVVAIGGYRSDLRDVVLRMKDPIHAPLTKAMGRLLAEKRFSQLAELHADVIAPIPMHWFHKWKRGINNPEHLAASLGQKLGVPVRNRLLVRRKNTLPQTELSPKERFRNVKGAFCIGPKDKDKVSGARILLVDDVLTTGATGSEAARILKNAGAAMVAVAVVARAQGER